MPMRAPYTGGHGVPAGYNAVMQNSQHQPRFTSPPQQAGGFRQPQPQPYAQQYSQHGQGYTQPRSGDTGRSHKGTLPPGQMVRVGQHAVRVERYLSEGGYAHVYLTSSDKPIYPPKRSSAKGRWGEKGYTTHCLKRIAFEDESVWRDVSREIEVMVRVELRSYQDMADGRKHFPQVNISSSTSTRRTTDCQMARMRCSFSWSFVPVGGVAYWLRNEARLRWGRT